MFVSIRKSGVEQRRKWLCVLGQVTYLPDLSALSYGMGFKLRNYPTYSPAYYGIQMTWCEVFHLPVHSANVYFVSINA